VNPYSSFWTGLAAPSRRAVRLAFSDIRDERVREAASRLKTLNVDSCFVEPDVELKKNPALQAYLQARLVKAQIPENEFKKFFADPLYVGMTMLATGEVDGLVGGASCPTSDVVRAALRCVGAKPDVKLVSGQFFIETAGRHSEDRTPFLLADCAVSPEPSSRVLAHTAVEAARSYTLFTGAKARVAFLSFSTRGSAVHPLVDRVREAADTAKKLAPELMIDGELQADAALDARVAKIKQAEGSMVAGRANVLIFPTLESGNIGYKLIQRFAETRIAGPLLWGLAKPASDLSRGCSVEEVVDSALCVAKMARGFN
jgi:phosphate acetyltransferase